MTGTRKDSWEYRMPRIIFFDIDGTILPFGENHVRPAVAAALNAVHSQGVRLFIATGRAPFYLPDLEGIPFDGYLCFNGSYCYDQAGMIYSHPLDPRDVKTVVRNAAEAGFPVTVATASGLGTNFYQKDLADYLAITHLDNHISPDFDRLQQEPVFQLMAGVTAIHDEMLVRNTFNAKTARWWDRAVDIIPRDCGKARGIEIVLRHYGIPVSESMAFGDGSNDAEMLAFAGTGVAMGNASPESLAAADYVTDSCHADGVVTAFRHFGLVG